MSTRAGFQLQEMPSPDQVDQVIGFNTMSLPSQKSQNQVLNVVPRTRIILEYTYNIGVCIMSLGNGRSDSDPARTPAAGFASMRTSDILYHRSFRNSIDADRSTGQPFNILLPSEIKWLASTASCANFPKLPEPVSFASGV